jgi:predicted acylesterase/phospholipase RssA
MGLCFLGVLRALHDDGVWSRATLRSVDGTSVGGWLAACVCLLGDTLSWDDLETYWVQRPWHQDVRVTPEQIAGMWTQKGVLDQRLIETAFLPLLKACDLSPTLTLLDLFAHSHLALHLHTFDVNTFSPVDVSHLTHPTLPLLTALTMTVAIPGVFAPVFWEGACLVDGGIVFNCPLPPCLDRGASPDRTVTVYRPDSVASVAPLTSASSVWDYTVAFTLRAVHQLRVHAARPPVPRTVACHTPPLSDAGLILGYIELVHSVDRRVAWVESGKTQAREARRAWG